MPDYTGKLVAYLDDDDVQLALVTSHGGKKLQLTTITGRQRKASDKQLVAVFPRTADLASLAAVGRELQAGILELRRAIDTALLWEFVRDEERDFELADLCEIWFSEATPIQQTAVFESVRDDALRFKVKGLTIQPRSATQVAEQTLNEQRQRERQAERERTLAWLRGVLEVEEPPTVPDAMLPVLRRLEDFLVRHHDDGIGDLLGMLRDGLAPRDAAYHILNITDSLPEGADPLLLVAGIQADFPPDVMAAAQRVAPFPADSGRPDFTDLLPVAIDDADTREVDDALTVEVHPHHLRVGIHIADVACFVDKDDALDREARHRSATIYLPTHTVTMLPDRVSCDLGSLQPGELRPCFSCFATFTAAGNLVDWELVRGQMRVEQRLTYEAADQLMATGDGETAIRLRHLLGIADALGAARAAAGAITILRPEVKVRVDAAGCILLKRFDTSTPSRRLVSELMILVNRLTAEYAASHDLPLIYRAQDPPERRIVPPSEYDPVANEEIFRQLKRGRMSSHPQPHAALGLAAYTQASSPLRRFTDLVIQRQVAASLAGTRPPYQGDELLGVLGAVEAAEQENRGLEREAVRYHILRYLDTLPKKEPLAAIVLRPLPGGYLVELNETLQRGRLWTKSQLEPGETVSVLLHQVDAKHGNLVVKPA